MRKSNAVDKKEGAAKESSVSKRVAEELHQRIDQAAEKGEQIERNLVSRSAEAHDKAIEFGAEAKEKAQQLNSGFGKFAHENPWAVMGGAVALGIVIGALSSRR